MTRNHPPLPALKEAFPFRLATTSYIVPAAIPPNIRFLGPYVDEVELVLFESGKEENLPSPHEIGELIRLAQEMSVRYSVHLPTDVFLGDPEPKIREKARTTVLRFYHRTLALDPTVYVLHLDRRHANVKEQKGLEAWQGRLRESLEFLLAEGLNPSQVAVENLDYPLAWVRPLVEDMGMSFCLDVGHLLRYGLDLHSYFWAFLSESSMVHLHGVQDGADHRSLSAISDTDWEAITSALVGFAGGVSLEVFSLEDLTSSLRRMEKLRRCCA